MYLPLNHNGSHLVALVQHIQMCPHRRCARKLQNPRIRNVTLKTIAPSFGDSLRYSIMKIQQAPNYSITIAGRGCAFTAIHYYVPAGQTKVPNSNMVVIMTMEERKKNKDL